MLSAYSLGLIITDFDAENGSVIRSSGLKQFELINELKVVLRRRYALGKNGKVVGPNPKRFALLTNGSAS